MAAPPLPPPLPSSASEASPILVAVDDEATPALEYAAQAARRAGCGLHLLHVVPPGAPATAHDEGEVLLRGVAARAAALTAGSAPVTTELAHAGPVEDVLVQRASAARQLVLQCRHDESGTGTCSRVVCRTACPVVTVPSRERVLSRVALREALQVLPALPEVLP